MEDRPGILATRIAIGHRIGPKMGVSMLYISVMLFVQRRKKRMKHPTRE